YNLRDEDEDPTGTPDFWPIPGWPEDDFSYMWTGSNDDYDVLLTVTNGQLIGLIAGNQKRFGIDRLADGSAYWMTDIRLEGFLPMDPPDSTGSTLSGTPNINTDHVFTSHLKEITLDEKSLNRGVNLTTLDILIVWTEQARIDAGGASGDPNDTQGIEALIATAVDHANLALSNSETNTRVTKFFTAKLNGFTVTGDPRADRNTLRDLASLNALRDQVGADVVTGMTRNAVAGGLMRVCGIAHVQTYPGCDSFPPLPGCGVGAAFNGFAYNLVAQNCAIFDDTFTHELGHLMGGNHPNVPGQLSASWAAAVINNGFPDAFGRIIPEDFASIMSIDFDTNRRLYFSNPDVTVEIPDGGTVSTGITDSMDNARVIDQLSPAMSVYRERPDLIFSHGFEL
ncbi:MAG: M12 family metallo-peptidase, partial [Proteobacteria bacterium]|nr:M12 family metallo-peptidase [Pseudomonadota bacterium]